MGVGSVVALAAAMLALLAACGGGAQGATGAPTSTPASAQPTATNETVAPSHNSASLPLVRGYSLAAASA